MLTKTQLALRRTGIGGSDIAARFWRDHIERKVPPPADGSDSARDALSRLYPHDRRPLLTAAGEQVYLLENYRAARRQRDSAQVRLDAMENRVRELIGDAAGIEWPGGRILWRAHPVRHTDWKGIVEARRVPRKVIATFTTIADQRPFLAWVERSSCSWAKRLT